MKSKIIYLCLSVVLVASIFTNLILWTDNSTLAVSIKSLTSEISSSANKPTPIPTSDYVYHGVDYSKVNPIDKFFDAHKDINTSYPIEKRIISYYDVCWKKEFDNAYKILLKFHNNDVSDVILKSKNSFITYAKNEANLYAYVEFTNAFGLDSGKRVPFNQVHGGSGFGSGYEDAEGKIYKSQVAKMIEYLDICGVQYKFVFKESKIDNEGHKIFK